MFGVEAQMSLLYLGIGRSVAIAPQVPHGLHRHSTLQITLALEHPFLFRTDSTEWTRTEAVAVDPGIPHQARELHGLFASLHILPERRFVRGRARGVLRDGPVHHFDEAERSEHIPFFQRLSGKETGCSQVFQKTERLVGSLTEAADPARHVDDRLLNVLEQIQNNLSGRLRLKDLAYAACLSGDRFLHLFKEELGITLRQYIGLQRIMRATEEIVGGTTLTRAALDAGFADSSHFTRRFSEFTGYLPNRLKNLRGSTRIFTCSSSRCVRPASLPAGCAICAECRLYRGAPSLRGDSSGLVQAAKVH
jgi:AraC-like DNA-binding protein